MRQRAIPHSRSPALELSQLCIKWLQRILGLPRLRQSQPIPDLLWRQLTLVDELVDHPEKNSSVFSEKNLRTFVLVLQPCLNFCVCTGGTSAVVALAVGPASQIGPASRAASPAPSQQGVAGMEPPGIWVPRTYPGYLVGLGDYARDAPFLEADERVVARFLLAPFTPRGAKMKSS